MPVVSVAQESVPDYTFDTLLRFAVGKDFNTYAINSANLNYVATFSTSEKHGTKMWVYDIQNFMTHKGTVHLQNGDLQVPFESVWELSYSCPPPKNMDLTVNLKQTITASAVFPTMVTTSLYTNKKDGTQQILTIKKWDFNQPSTDYNPKDQGIVDIQDPAFKNMLPSLTTLLHFASALELHDENSEPIFLYASPINVALYWSPSHKTKQSTRRFK